MTECLINPTRLPKDPKICGPCLLWPNPGEKSYIHQEAKIRNASPVQLFHSTLFALSDPHPYYWAGPAMGAPMAAFCLEKLIACGCTKCLVFGTCGSLSSSLAIGDILIPTWFHSEEGTSQHYKTQARRLETTPTLREQLTTFLDSSHLSYRSGPLWTTDAPYRESHQKVAALQGRGVLGVDMELAALAAVAAFRGIQLSAALIISDELFDGRWRPGYGHKRLRATRKSLFQTLNLFVQTISNS